MSDTTDAVSQSHVTHERKGPARIIDLYESGLEPPDGTGSSSDSIQPVEAIHDLRDFIHTIKILSRHVTVSPNLPGSLSTLVTQIQIASTEAADLIKRLLEEPDGQVIHPHTPSSDS